MDVTIQAAQLIQKIADKLRVGVFARVLTVAIDKADDAGDGTFRWICVADALRKVNEEQDGALEAVLRDNDIN